MDLTIKGSHNNLGLFIMRLGIGLIMIYHGLPKLTGGPEKWQSVGEAMQFLGIDLLPLFFGFMSALAETFGGLLLILGLYSLPALILLLFNMGVAIAYHIGSGDGFAETTPALVLLFVFTGFLLTGPGYYSFDYHWIQKRLI